MDHICCRLYRDTTPLRGLWGSMGDCLTDRHDKFPMLSSPVPFKFLIWKWWPETGSENFFENDCELTTARLNHVEILSRSTVGTGTSTGFGRGFIMKLDVHRTSAAHGRDRVGEF